MNPSLRIRQKHISRAQAHGDYLAVKLATSSIRHPLANAKVKGIEKIGMFETNWRVHGLFSTDKIRMHAGLEPIEEILVGP